MSIIEVKAEVNIDDVVDDVFNHLATVEVFDRIKDDDLFQEVVRRTAHLFQHFFDYFEGDMPLMNSVDFARLKGAVDKEHERRLSLESKCEREQMFGMVTAMVSDMTNENGV